MGESALSIACSLWLAAGFAAAQSAGGSAAGSNPNPSAQSSPENTAKEADTHITKEQAREDLDKQMTRLGIPERYADVLRSELNQKINQGVPIEKEAMKQFLNQISDMHNVFQIALQSHGHPTDEQRRYMQRSAENLFRNLDEAGPLKDSMLRLIGRVAKDDTPNGFLQGVLERTASRFAEDHPEGSTIHEVLGGLHAVEGRPREALRDYTEALRWDPGNREALQGRSDVRYKLGDYVGADQDAQAVLRLDPTNPAAIAMLQLTNGRAGPSAELAQAGPVETQAGSSGTGFTGARPPSADSRISLSPAQAQSAQYAKQAASAIEVGDFAKAVELAQLATKLNPNNAQAYNYQAIAFIRSGRYDKAIEGADQGLGVLPKNPVLTITKAYALNRRGRYKEAITTLEGSGFGYDSSSADALCNLAYAEAGIGDHSAMLNALGKAATLDGGRFGQLYQMAAQAPEGSDLKYLFGSERASDEGSSAAQASAKKNGTRRYFLLVLIVLVGGFLIAAGLLQTMAPRWNRSRSGVQRSMADAVNGSEAPRQLLSGVYKITRQIGSGGMGTVYEAMDVNLQRPVALKKMRAEIREDPRERQRFLKEARMVAALHHPNIVEIYSIVEDASDLCLIFEYVEGKTLHEILAEKGPLSLEHAKKILREVCRALEYAHSQHVIHRDLKPANVMVTKWGTVKVMDFGIAREVQEAVSRLMTNTVAGTPPYMAPEMERGAVGKEIDVYALGVCLYELLSGEVPFAGTGMGMLQNKMNMDFRPLSSLVKDLPPGVDELIAGALQADPARRIRTPAQFISILESLAVRA